MGKKFCPKLVTLETYNYKGPSKTEFTMREELKMQTKEAINTIPIQQFIQQVKVADAGNKGNKNDLAEAKNLMLSF